MIRVALLSVTHERPEWLPWLYEQIRELRYQADILDVEVQAFVVDSSQVPAPQGDHVNVATSDSSGIAAKRNYALGYAGTWRPNYFAWLDDDDWSHPHRLVTAIPRLEDNPWAWAYGNTVAPMVNARTLESWEHRSSEPVIFNGAVYRWPAGCKQFPLQFNESLVTGEDTDWNERYLRRQAYMVTPHPLHAWLCHGSNITNRADRHCFDRPFPENLSRFRATFESNPARKR